MTQKLHLSVIVSLFIALNSFTLSQDDDFNDSNENNAVISVSGTVTDSKNNKPIAGANVMVDGTDEGIATDTDGTYSFDNIEAGASITVSIIGYEEQTLYADSESLDFSMVSEVLEMSSLEVLASRAGDKTAVNYTNITKEELSLRLGSQDIPMALNTVPSVYATGQGGGAGDTRINVRGFNQRNVAIMINGVPVNDMENGWVYWSNWDGLADATSSIQMQKGLSSQNLATPSIGGSMNIITDPSSQERKGLFKQEVGAFGFLKTTMSFHSGLMMDDKFALSGTLVRKVGEGYYAGTWTDAYAYYFDATYALNNNHRFQFYALGAPQRHGQNLYAQNIAVYDTEFAKSLDDYDQEALTKFNEAGRDFNQNVGTISEASQSILDAAGGQHWQMYSIRDGVDRHESDNLSERENFFHKPQVALNHYWTIDDKMNLSTSAYWSGGMGGGTGHYGSVDRSPAVEGNNWWASSPWTWNYDKTIAYNDTSSTGSKGILRNSNNRQSTLGLLSKFNYKVNENLETQIGLDWRTAEIYHVKTIRDLLGGDYFVNTDSDFDAPNQQKGLGDPIDYNFTNNVDWLGLFGQFEYNTGPITSYGMAGVTTVKYTHWNHFKAAADYDYAYVEAKDGSDADWVEGPGEDMGGNPGELYIEADPISTSQVKGGVMYSMGDMLSPLSFVPVFGKVYENADVWFNFGLIDKAPIFDQVIQDWDAKMSTDPSNEKFQAFELGLNTSSNDGSMAGKLSYYSTTWSDRIQTKTVVNLDGDDDIVYLTGIDQVHSGIELEFAAQISPLIRIDLGLGLGSWEYTKDPNGTYRDGDTDLTYAYALNGLNVGDMPQRNLVMGFTLTPIEGAKIQASYRYYDKHVADWTIGGREYDPSTEEGNFSDEIWQAPSYGVLDLHAYYDIPFELGPAKPQLYLHVFNALDEVYIQDATHNSRYNSWDQKGSQADDAEVYLGLPARFNIGLSVNF